MKSRAAIQLNIGEKPVIDLIDIPDPQPHQVAVKMFASGVCQTQLHHLHQKTLGRPLGLGHEGTGIITKVGTQVEHISEGDHAIITWVPRKPISGRKDPIPSGTKHRGKLLQGLVYTWTEHTLVNADMVVKMSREYPTDVTSVIGCAVLTGAGAVLNTAQVKPGNSVAIFGVGGVGLSAVQAAAISGASPIIAIDLTHEKLEFAREFGATHTINANSQDAVEAVRDLSDGGVDFAFDTIGVRITTEQILPATKGGGPGADNHGGVAILVGIPREPMTLDPGLFVYHQRRYRGSLGAVYPEKDFDTFLKWNQDGKFPLSKLVTDRYSLDQVNQACEALERGSVRGRAIIEYTGGTD